MSPYPPPNQLQLSWWQILLGLMLLIAIVYGLSEIRFRLRAPLALDVRAESCYLSPGGSYMYIKTRNGSIHDLPIYALSDGAKITMALREPIGLARDYVVWLSDSRFFYTLDWEKATDGAYLTPSDGWILDLETETITNTLDLEPELRAKTLEQAKQIKNSLYDRSPTYPIISPDGKYAFRPLSITDTNTGQILNRVPLKHLYTTIACVSGWRPDSGGYYFIDRPSLTFRSEPGPIRLLLTHPPVP